MPAYSSTGNRVVLYPGDAQTVWSAEKPADSSASMQVALAPNQLTADSSISAQVIFATDPGTFEVDIQTCDAPDVDASYVSTTAKISNSTNFSAGFTGNVQIIGVRADFARLVMKTHSSNSVACTATITLG